MPGHGWCYRHRRGRIGRPPKPVSVGFLPSVQGFNPYPPPPLPIEPVVLEPAEVEALRLVDLEKLSYEEAGARMGVSRTTVWRLVESGREKLVSAILEGRPIVIAQLPGAPGETGQG
ncbi:DUF134 domain-containing protein [Thermofilum pendens]|uniref:UPF0251 protein Tpen_1763 n=1 Tax=Thermofilum pendens (strain DSM 2475 / Hrk 5) TaxID=368408 RepID=A1S128_THEPD|nr:DUF134 domain-containing protein [Thermofilum pendens]ABL79158.1 protein of unknown function DUF134 [Thermofilum pendens Hrk 5]